MQGPAAVLLDGGRRLHLQHGPIDLIVGVDARNDVERNAAFEAAATRFDSILNGLVSELPTHRMPLRGDTPDPADPTACRMYRAARPFCGTAFLTPMIAVAGSVSDEVLAAILAVTAPRRAYVNNGGDIALHLAGDATYAIAMAGVEGSDLGRITIDAHAGIGGIATSGSGGRSLSLGIATSVTVLARCAAEADVAATLIANAVDLPDHPGISRAPAETLHPDSDLGDRLVVTRVPPLAKADKRAALEAGRRRAARMVAQRQILAAALFLQGESAHAGPLLAARETRLEIA